MLHVVELLPALSESPVIAGLDVAAIETERLSRLRRSSFPGRRTTTAAPKPPCEKAPRTAKS